MVKVSILSDVHLKMRRFASFELNRFELLIDHLQQSDADIIIFNGDLLDIARPSLEEVKAITDALEALGDKEVYIVDGNHEAVTKQASTYDYLKLPNVHNHQNKSKLLTIEGVDIQLCGWSALHELPDLKADVLISHYRSAIEGLFEEEVDTSKFINNYGLILLGDIHSRYSPSSHIFYTGCPYPIQHIKDSREKFGYVSLVVDNGSTSWSYVDLDLPKKIRIDMTYKQLTEFDPNPEHMYKLFVSGTLDELRSLASTDKIRYVKVVTALLADPTTTAEPTEPIDISFIDKLAKHVKQNLQVPAGKIRNVLNTLQGD